MQYSNPQMIIETLQPFISKARQARVSKVLSGRLGSITVAIEAPADINNALAAVRTCEALGVTHIHLIAPQGDAGAIRAVTQGAFYWVTIKLHPSLEDFLQSLPHASWQLAGAVMEAPVPLCEVPIDQPLCLLLGNEQRGLSISAKNACDFLYSIPMFGMSESLNLSVSAAISLYDTTQRKRNALGQNSDLSAEEYLQLQAKYYLRSVNPKLAASVLNPNTSPD